MAGKETLRERLEQLVEKGEEALNQISEEIRTSPGFVKAVEGARKGQEVVEASIRKAARRIDAPSRDEFTTLVSRVSLLEKKLARLTRLAGRQEVPPKKSLKSTTKPRRRV